MSSDAVTEVSEQSWFARIRNSLLGLLLGPLLFLVGFPLLWWNEGRAVRTAKGLAELDRSVVDVAVQRIDPQYDQKPVHVTAEASTADELHDPEFGVALSAVKLRRRVEMYQWEEERRESEHKKIGGGTRTETTYEYRRTWSEKPIDSGSFHQASGHENPGTMRFRTEQWMAPNVRCGVFLLSPDLLNQWNAYETLDMDPQRKTLPAELGQQLQPRADGYYLGRNPDQPQIGDLRISFQVVRPAVVSLLAQQAGNTFRPWRSSTGTGVDRLMPGSYTAEEMVGQLQRENTILTWLLRAGGFLLMTFGIALFFRPLSVLGDVLPILGDVVGLGVGLAALALAGLAALLTISVAWLFYRPLLGIGLLLAAGVLIYWARSRGRARKALLAPMPIDPSPTA